MQRVDDSRDCNYQELIDALGHEPLRTSDGHFIAGLLSAREDDLAVPSPLQFFNLGQPGEQLAVIKTVNADNLGGELGVLGVLELVSAADRVLGRLCSPLDRPFRESRSSRAQDSGHCELEYGK